MKQIPNLNLLDVDMQTTLDQKLMLMLMGGELNKLSLGDSVRLVKSEITDEIFTVTKISQKVKVYSEGTNK